MVAIHAIPTWGLKQEDHKFEASPDYVLRPILDKWGAGEVT